MDAGPARQRRRFTDVPEELTLTWKFTATEMGIFRLFWIQTLNYGTDWLTMTLDLGNGMTAYDVRFTKPYKYQAQPGMNWLVSADIEVSDA
jgi:hypothetical protein